MVFQHYLEPYNLTRNDTLLKGIELKIQTQRDSVQCQHGSKIVSICWMQLF